MGQRAGVVPFLNRIRCLYIYTITRSDTYTPLFRNECKYGILFRNICENQPGEGIGTPWLCLWKKV